MPRRTRSDALSLALGNRIKHLRQEAGLTIERLAFETEVGSKGHLSSIERGLVRPTTHTLKALADGLGVRLADMVTFPEEDTRDKLFDLARGLESGQVQALVRQAEGQLARRVVLQAAEEPDTYHRPGRR